jgi:hypothetical protein
LTADAISVGGVAIPRLSIEYRPPTSLWKLLASLGEAINHKELELVRRTALMSSASGTELWAGSSYQPTKKSGPNNRSALRAGFVQVVDASLDGRSYRAGDLEIPFGRGRVTDVIISGQAGEHSLNLVLERRGIGPTRPALIGLQLRLRRELPALSFA